MIWAFRNWQLVLIAALAFLLGLVGIRSASLSNRLAAAKAKAAGIKREIEAHETRNEIDNRIAADRDPRRELHRDWSE